MMTPNLRELALILVGAANDFRVLRPLRQTCRADRQPLRHAPVVPDL
jgi:hypothetical protein